MRLFIKRYRKTERSAGYKSMDCCGILRSESMKKKKLVVLALCGMLACGGVVGGAYAYYSGISQTAENQFTIKAGKQDETNGDKVGEIEEGLWDEDNADDLAPNQEVPKNPKFISYAEYEAWCIMKVSIPTERMKIGDDTTAAVYDVVTLEGLDTANWTLLKAQKSGTAGTNSVYYYGYQETLAKGEETSELFTAIKVPNITELDENVQDSVDVAAHIVQAEGYASVAEAFATLGIE